MNRTSIGVGLVGAGFMCKAHSNAYKTIPYMFEDSCDIRLEAVCASRPSTAQAAQKRYGYRQAYSDYSQLVSDPSVDLVDICVPDALHVPSAAAAIKAGKHVLCEKPMALSGLEAAQLLQAAEKAGIVHAVAFNYRFLPPVRLAYEMIRRGELGKIHHIHVRYYQQSGADPMLPAEDVWYIGKVKSGVLQGIGTHAIDQARFLIGEIAEISAIASVDYKQRPSKAGGSVPVEIEDSARAVVRFTNDATGLIECSCVARGHSNDLSWEICGSKGSVRFQLEQPSYLQVYLESWEKERAAGFVNINVNQAGHPFSTIWWPEGHNIGWEHGHINLIEHLLECICTGAPVDPLGATFADGFKAAAAVDAIRMSSKTGERVDFTDFAKKLLS